ncbi:putative reverse transcriptase domain-containing protein, partial [Tanacetum coccineum]
PDHVDDVPVVEPNQHDDVPIVPEPVLVDEDKDPEEDKFEEEEDPQEEEDDMEVNIEEDKNEHELTYPYKEVDPLNPLLLASESEPEDANEVENPIEHEDKTVPTSVHEVDINFLFGQMDSLSRQLCGREMTHALVEKKFLRMQNERVERDLYWTRVRAHEFYQEMIRRGFIIMPPKSAPLTQAALHRMIKESIDAERARHANAGNDARGSGLVRGQDAAPAARECTFAGFMKWDPITFHGTEGAVELRRWFKTTESVFGISECADGKKVKFAVATLQGPSLTWWNAKVATMDLETVNQMPWTEMKQLMTAELNELALMCPRMVEPKREKVYAYIQGLTDNIKGEVTSSRPANLNEAVHMAHKLMEQKSQARDERILDGKKRKWESLQSGKSSVYDQVPQVWKGWAQVKGHTRNRCPKKIKQEEVGEIHGRAYAIKDAEPQGPNVVTGTFLLNSRYGFVLFNSSSDRSFVDTRFSSMLNIDPVKIRDSYEVELADGRLVSMNTILKGCTFNLVNHNFEIDFMPIELGTFDVIIDMDWLVKHDAIIICGEKVVRIPYGNKTLIVESDKGVS